MGREEIWPIRPSSRRWPGQDDATLPPSPGCRIAALAQPCQRNSVGAASLPNRFMQVCRGCRPGTRARCFLGAFKPLSTPERPVDNSVAIHHHSCQQAPIGRSICRTTGISSRQRVCSFARHADIFIPSASILNYHEACGAERSYDPGILHWHAIATGLRGVMVHIGLTTSSGVSLLVGGLFMPSLGGTCP